MNIKNYVLSQIEKGNLINISTKKVPAGLDSRVERYVQGTTLPTTGTNKNIQRKEQSVNSSISENDFTVIFTL